MIKAILCTVAIAALHPFSASAQVHDHGQQPSDTETTQPADAPHSMMQQMQEGMQGMQQMMQQMQERMQGMQQAMQSHGRQEGSMDMQAMRMQGESMNMQGQPMGERVSACAMTDPECALSALLLGSVEDLGLSEAQRTALNGILEQARSEARAALTDEQRVRLEPAPEDHAGNGGGGG